MGYQRHLRIVLTVVTWAIFWPCATALAQLDPQGYAAHVAAKPEWQARLGAAARTGQLPRLANASDRELILKLFDHRSVFRGPQAKQREIGELLDLINTQNAAMRQYIAAVTAPAPALPADKYAPEIAQIFDFSGQVAANTTSAARDFFTSNPQYMSDPVRISGLRQFKTGLSGMLAGALVAASDAGVEENLRLKMLGQYMANIDLIAVILSGKDRQALTNRIDALIPSAQPAIATAMNRMRQGLIDSPCDAICMLD